MQPSRVVPALKPRAIKAAAEADARIASGKSLGELDGVAIAVKDNFCMEVRGLSFSLACLLPARVLSRSPSRYAVGTQT
jgi:Asp-tRNA(Asn)/Glu-tRNA(Gln) amidotransferase A subunit family amidase